MAALLRMIARHPVAAFMLIALAAGFLTAAIRPIADADVLPFDLPLHGFLGGVFGVGLGAFLVTGALAGRPGVVDLARRSVRWRSHCVGIWSRSSPFRSAPPSFRLRSMACKH
jgi:hypothetical protein